MIPAEAYSRDNRPGENFESSPAMTWNSADENWRGKYSAANWVKPLLDPVARKKFVAYSIERIRDKFPSLKALAFTGLSGSIIAGPVALELELPLYAVRKSNESRHSERVVEGLEFNHSQDYLIIDDFVNTGTTIRRIAEMIHQHTGGAALCIGVYCWRDDEFYTGEHLRKLLMNDQWIRGADPEPVADTGGATPVPEAEKHEHDEPFGGTGCGDENCEICV